MKTAETGVKVSTAKGGTAKTTKLKDHAWGRGKGETVCRSNKNIGRPRIIRSGHQHRRLFTEIIQRKFVAGTGKKETSIKIPVDWKLLERTNTKKFQEGDRK